MQYTIFDKDSHYSSKWYIFKSVTELGAIHGVIDWDSLEGLLPKKKTMRGAPGWLGRRGLFGLMFLKHYTGLSDEKLLERFHTDWAMQLFCGVLLQDNERIRDTAFVSRVRKYLSFHLDLNQFQDQMLSHWKAHYMTDKHVQLSDATCYESYIRYPTDVKLLWECCEKLWSKMIPELSQAFGLKRPRSKYLVQRQKYLGYSKLRKKSRRKTLARRKALLRLLSRGIDCYQQLLHQSQGQGLSEKLSGLFRTIKHIYQQQEYMLKNAGSTVKHRIVSLHKPYVRPIVRGKENKPVEFGMKVHMNQTGGINIIEHASFDNFNECKRLKISIVKHKHRFGDCTHISADRIYATNENRRYVTAKGIHTNFDKKGPVKDDKATQRMKQALNGARSAYMEGSFGNEKNHYGLRKIKALSQGTELVWLFFGVMTANAVRISKMARDNLAKAA